MGSTSIQGRSYEFPNHWGCSKKKDKGDGKAEETSELKKAVDGKEEGKTGESKGRKFIDITKKVLLALAIAALCVSGVVAVAALIFGLVLMFVPGVGTTIGGGLAAISASFGAAIGAAITFLATHATAVVIASSTLLGVTALGAAGLIIATKLCKKKKKDGDGEDDKDGGGSGLSSSQESTEAKKKQNTNRGRQGDDRETDLGFGLGRGSSLFDGTTTLTTPLGGKGRGERRDNFLYREVEEGEEEEALSGDASSLGRFAVKGRGRGEV